MKVMRRKRQTLLKALVACIALILVLGIVYSGLRIMELTVFYGQEREFEVKTKTITHNGIKYFPRQDINVILVMGINQSGPAHAEEPNHGNAADMVALVVFDEQAQTCNVLNLNRDTMMDMPALDTEGKNVGSMYAQLGYAHTYGTGMQDSCENTKMAVSNFLGGVNIDYYVSMNMDAIAVLNDAVGGVTVNITDDFSQVDASLPKGTVTLMGDQARSFVQSRMNVGDQLNLSRIERQKQYMNNYVTAFKETVKSSDTQFVLETYNEVAPYLVSDLPVSTLTGMVERYIDYPLSSVISLEGENKLGEEYYEFYADEEILKELRLELFYAPK